MRKQKISIDRTPPKRFKTTAQKKYLLVKNRHEILNLILRLRIGVDHDQEELFSRMIEHQSPQSLYSIQDFDETKCIEEERLITASESTIKKEVKEFLFYFIRTVDEKREEAVMRRYFSKVNSVKVQLNKVVISIIKGCHIKEYYVPLKTLLNREYEKYSFNELIGEFKEL